jgi:methionine-rich copper-binding protein CopC
MTGSARARANTIMAAKRQRWVGLALALALLGGLLVVETAHAHATYVRSEPGAGAVIATAPARVEIWFAQDMFRRRGENWIKVTGPTGGAVHVGEATIDDDDRRHLTVDLMPDLPPGEYRVAWRTLSAEDGDAAEDTFTFTIDPQAEVTSTPMLAVTPTPIVQVTATAPAVTFSPTPTPAPARGVGCGGALAPAVGLVALGLGVQRRRRP